MRRREVDKSERKFGWAGILLGFWVATVSGILLSAPSRKVLVGLSVFAGLSLSFSAYYFGLVAIRKWVRSTVVLTLIWGVGAWIVYVSWPATFTVYQGQVFLAGKHRVAMLWLANPSGVCPSHVAIYMFIRNDHPLAARISDLRIEAYVNGAWVNLPIMDTRNARIVMGNRNSGFVEVDGSNFVDRQLEFHAIAAADSMSGWLLLDYPEAVEDPNGDEVPKLRAIITNNDERTVHAIAKAPKTLEQVSLRTEGDANDVRDLKTILHCGSGLTW
jgi:hypothetical protein